MTAERTPQRLLVATVGGSPEAVVAGVLASRPARAVFICTPDSRKSISSAPPDVGILERLEQEGFPFDPGRFDVVELPDAQDLTAAVDVIQREATPLVQRWLARGAEFEALADFTGGTKCMSVALGLVSRLWPCRLQYVGGTERTKGGAGVVVSGREQVVHFRNPWDVLGYQCVDEAVVVFDRGDAGSAALVLERARNQASAGPVKTAFTALHHFVELYAQWDRFQHSAALDKARAFENNAFALTVFFAPAQVDRLRAAARSSAAFLATLPRADTPSREFVLDLAANANRRLAQGRFDDALARLYRAIEALGQWRLASAHGIVATSRVPLSAVPEPLFSRWQPVARDGELKLALQDAFELLAVLGDAYGARFVELGLAGNREEHARGSPLAARNSSILAHGFRPARADDVRGLLGKLLALLEETEAALPVFPLLRSLAQ